MTHNIKDCQYCGEPYCVTCSDADYRNEFCSVLCQERSYKDAADTAENERLEGISFDKQRGDGR